ncbi:MAG: hypothetical protein PHW31_04020 [Candidatus Pacebacteria bacterium]|nr:hypothetical protein [Candidatus Paceibacterota bacterium]
MSDGMLLLVGFLITVVVALSLYMFFTRSSRACKSIFDAYPKKMTQEIVNKKMQELQEALARYEYEESVPSDIDEDVAGYIESKLERAKKLAERYGFITPSS